MNIKHPKVQSAINHISIAHPFFASIMLQTEFIEDNKSKTFWTDGKRIGYNSNFADSLTFDETVGVICHEAYHIFLLHFSRMGERDVEVWNSATDYLINFNLISNGFKLPKGILLDSRFQNTNAEDVYRTLMLEKVKKEVEKEKKNGKKSDSGEDSEGGGGKGEESEENKPAPDCGFGEVRAGKVEEAKENEERAIIMGKMAEIAAKQCGNMPAGIERMLAESRKTITDWREVLNRFLNEVTAKDYCFSRPNKRFLDRGFVLPSLYSKTIGKIVVAVDVSGSVSEQELNRLLGEVVNILDYINESSDAAEIDIIYFDTKVTGHQTYTGGEKLKAIGGGGTDFRAPFDYIAEKELNPELAIILTDGECYQFPTEPEYPVLWALTISYGNKKFPFGEQMILS